MKKLKLSIAERLTALAIFNNPENKVATENLKVYLDDVNQFRVSEEEKKEIKWNEEKNDKGMITRVTWKDEGVDMKQIKMDEFTSKFLTEKLDGQEYSATDLLAVSAISLLEKLKN